MASVTTGTGDAVFKDEQTIFDPQSGWQTVRTWTGSKNGILAQADALRTSGWKVTTSQKGAFWQCVASNAFQADSSGNPSNDVAVDRWRISTEWAQIDIRNAPSFISLAQEAANNLSNLDFGGGVTTGALSSGDILARWKADIENAILKGVNLKGPRVSQEGIDPILYGSIYDGEKYLFNLYARGTESYEIRRPVLSRVRTISTSYPSPFIMDAVESIWTTSALVRDFAIPDNIKNRLPTDPSEAPTESNWGWKLRRQDSDIVLATNRIEENYEWVFAAWSGLLYDVIQ